MRAILRHLADRPVLLAELLAASLLINLLGLAGTAFVMLVLGRYVPYGVDATLVTLTLGVALAALFEFGFREARRRLATDALEPRKEEWAAQGFAALVGMRAATLDAIPPALRAETMRGLDAIDKAYTAANLASLLDIPFTLVTLVALFFLSPTLAVIALLCLALSAGVALAGERWARRTLPALQAAETRVLGLVSEAMTNADAARAFNATGLLRGRWSEAREAAAQARETLAAGQGLAGSAAQLLTAAQGIVIIAVGAVLCVKGELSTAQLIGANILASRALGPLNRLVQLIDPLAKAESALTRLAEFAHLPRERLSGTAVRDYSGRLELVDVAFAFPGAATPLGEHVNLRLEPGSVLVVTGPNGSGKSTFARLLVGLAEPLRGQILADGIDLRQLGLEWWRRQVSYLPQEPTFITGTVADNIRLANPELDDTGLNRVAVAAGLKRWLDGSADGFATRLADGGRHLPPGIRRRLGLARALATGGRLCVFDEPTEGLDPEGMAAVYVALRQLAHEGRTLIICGNDPIVARAATLLMDLGVKPQPRLTARTGVEESADA